MAHLLLPWFFSCILFQSSFLYSKTWIRLQPFCYCILLPKRGCQSCIIVNLWAVFMYFCATIHALLELWVHKACNLYCGKSGWWYWPRSCNCPHLRLNQPPVFSSEDIYWRAWLCFYARYDGMLQIKRGIWSRLSPNHFFILEQLVP